MSDYIPGPDLDYDEFVNVFTNYVVANAAAVGISVAMSTALQDARVGFMASLAQLQTVEAGALAVVDGEISEASSVLQDARLARSELERLQASYSQAAAACQAAG